MSEAIILKIEGKRKVMLKTEFDLGDLKEENKDTTTYTMPIGIEFTKQLAYEGIKRAIKNEDHDEFDTMLEEYCKSWLNDLIGVQSYPIRVEKEEIRGFKDTVKIIEE